MTKVKSYLWILALAMLAMALPARGQNAAEAEFVADAAAYTAGDAVGAAATLAGVGKAPKDSRNGLAILDSLTVSDEANQKAALTLLFFRGSAPALTNNVAFSIDAASTLTNYVGKYNVATVDYETVDSKAFVAKSGIGLLMNLKDTTNGNLYVVAVTTGTPTYGAGKKLRIECGFRQ